MRISASCGIIVRFSLLLFVLISHFNTHDITPVDVNSFTRLVLPSVAVQTFSIATNYNSTEDHILPELRDWRGRETEYGITPCHEELYKGRELDSLEGALYKTTVIITILVNVCTMPIPILTSKSIANTNTISLYCNTSTLPIFLDK